MGWLDTGSKKVLIMLRSDEPRVAILLQEQRVDVFLGSVKSEACWIFHFLLYLLHSLSVDVNFTRSPWRQKLSTRILHRSHHYHKSDFQHLLINLPHDPWDLRLRGTPQLVYCRPEPYILVAVFLPQIVGKFL